MHSRRSWKSTSRPLSAGSWATSSHSRATGTGWQRRLGRDETYLWPDALSRDRAAAVAESEVVRVYPHRSDVTMDEWRQLFESGEEEIGVLVYAGLFLAEDAGLQRVLRKRAKAGARVRILIGDPDDPRIAERGEEEGIGTPWPPRSAMPSSCTATCPKSRTSSSVCIEPSSTTRSSAPTTGCS